MVEEASEAVGVVAAHWGFDHVYSSFWYIREADRSVTLG